MKPLKGPLPDRFTPLQPWVDAGWALPSESARTDKRHSCEMTEITAFSQAMLARIDDIVEYLNSFSLDEMPADARQLYFLMMSLAEVAPAVELYGQPLVVDGYEYRRFIADEDCSLRPPL
jgi:hypothetical protein